MLKQILELMKQIFLMNQDLQHNKETIKSLQQEIKDMRGEMRDLNDTVRQLAFEIYRAREHDDHEREKLELRLENKWLRENRSLLENKNQPAE